MLSLRDLIHKIEYTLDTIDVCDLHKSFAQAPFIGFKIHDVYSPNVFSVM